MTALRLSEFAEAESCSATAHFRVRAVKSNSLRIGISLAWLSLFHLSQNRIPLSDHASGCGLNSSQSDCLRHAKKVGLPTGFRSRVCAE